ncbi:MAG TPA: L-rhamnose isomerase [Candidatus Gallimonas intestinavium]|uniref:L-rhamnose isomerase n=1 Tax=Candidatus Gallimonas intestinavium TaxID=2838603 RepID=A0A9D2G4F7_9FIRM|nr:L-rhamnose isomerase [Candidatus Gallimonas intestinavium]
MSYQEAKQAYAAFVVDTDAAIAALKNVPISVHCWQGDDVLGFEGAESLTGGIQTTGNYPGRARTPEELLKDYAFALSLMPGKKRINVHASYAFLGEDKGKVDRDKYEPKHFAPWVKFAKEHGYDGIDFNPTFFAHPKMKDGLTLSSPDEETRTFWVEHGKRCMEIAAYLGKEMGSPCLVNIWIPDGYKDVPADRLGPRKRYAQSLDEMLEGYDKEWVIPAIESKVFGIGVESYTVGSNEFCQNYAATRGICSLLDNGHYHPTEVVSDKIPSMLTFYDKVALHVSRPVRWDSDHVVIFEDELKEIMKEVVRNDALDKVKIALDYFDASINRVFAWVTGERSVQKALLYALLLPNTAMKEAQEKGEFTRLMYLQERVKVLPFGDVWAEYLKECGLDDNYFETISEYEKTILEERK